MKKMKRSLLGDVIGMPVESAEETVRDAGWKPQVYPVNAVITALAFPDHVFLWERNGVVEFATAGDPIQLED